MKDRLVSALDRLSTPLRVATLRSAFLSRHLFKPRVFSIEINLSCNLKCPECALGGDHITRKREQLSFEKFRAIADKIEPYARMVFIMIWGEPLLNKEIVPMIRYASRFARTCISTNGMLVDREMAEELITSGLGDLLVSIDGATQETYGQYRVKGDLPRVLGALRVLHELNEAHGRPVNLIPQFIVFEHNQHEMGEFERICHEIGVEPQFKAPYLIEGSRFSSSPLPEYNRATYSDVPSIKKAMRHCQDPRKAFTALVDGTVVACCYDYNGETGFGNILEDDVMDIWCGERFREFRRSVIEGNAPAFCTSSCLQYNLATRAATEETAGEEASRR